MSHIQTFDPAAAGLRVADGPIKRRARRPSSKKVPRPQYADAVWYSFSNGSPLEAVVPVRAVEDTIRKLKAAARFLERTEGAEVRVQIGVEASKEDPKQSVVKFLGHEPWLLGRRVAKAAADSDVAQIPPPRQGDAPRPRRSTAATRGQHTRQASLRASLVRAVITSLRPLHPVNMRGEGSQCFTWVFPPRIAGIAWSLPRSYPDGTIFLPRRMRAGVYSGKLGAGRQGLPYFREYIEVTDDGRPYTAEVRMCHDFPSMRPTGGNQVVILDERVAGLARADWSGDTTDTWSIMA